MARAMSDVALLDIPALERRHLVGAMTRRLNDLQPSMGPRKRGGEGRAMFRRRSCVYDHGAFGDFGRCKSSPSPCQLPH
eukprot:9467478-Pyramimonas_sp.AAC.1